MQLKTKKTRSEKNKTRCGDTIIEAVIAIAIYSVVSVLALGSMNSGLKTAQKNLESTMSRAAMDAQESSLRHIYEVYNQTKEGGGKEATFYGNIWNKITGSSAGTINGGETANEERYSYVSKLDSTTRTCEDMIEKDYDNSAIFAINSRALYSPEILTGTTLGKDFGFQKDTIARDQVIIKGEYIKAAELYPRIIYKPLEGTTDNSTVLIGSNEGSDDDTEKPSRNYERAEGIWVVSVKEESREGVLKNSNDFYIRTCWNAAGEQLPSTFTTVVRFYEVN